MKNPIPKTGLFATPQSLEQLMEYCQRFSGQERVIAITVATMALNLAHDLVESAAEEVL
jgi:archaellum biogenesis ATPase FlaH